MNANKELILMALETSYGVDASPVVALHALRAANISATPMETEEKELEYKKETFGSTESIITRINSKLSFDMYVAGSGAAGTVPPVGIPLQACGHSETIVPGDSVIYAPVAVGIKSATIYFYKDGILHKMLGCYGTMKKTYPAGEPPKWTFDFQGIYCDPEDTTMPTNTNWDRYISPRAVIPTFTGAISIFGNDSFHVKEFTVDGKRKIVSPPWANFDETLISDATPDGSFEAAMKKLVEINLFQKVKMAEKGEILYTHGNVPGNIIETLIPSALLSKPEYGDNEDTLTQKLNFKALHKDGNDDAVYTFK
jgi:hypothetical protein